MRWQEDVATCLDVGTYLRVHLKGSDLLQFARDRARKAHETPEQLRLAQAFEKRVQSYVENMRDDLQADAVAAPTDFIWTLAPLQGFGQMCG